MSPLWTGYSKTWLDVALTACLVDKLPVKVVDFQLQKAQVCYICRLQKDV